MGTGQTAIESKFRSLSSILEEYADKSSAMRLADFSQKTPNLLVRNGC